MSSIAGNTSTTETLSPAEVFTRTIDSATDADWLRVSLTTGLTYGFTVSGFGGPGIGMPDPDAQFYDGTGSLLVSYNNSGSSINTFSYAAAASGTYYIGVSDGFGDTGGYRVTWVSTDNIVNNSTTTRVMAAGQTVSSRLDVAYDSDWVKVTMAAGLSYAFQVQSGGGSDLLEDADLFIRNSSGNVVLGSPNGSSSVNYTSMLIQNAGTYYVEISDNGFADTGSYVLSWVSTDNVVNNTSTARTLARNTATTSRIDVSQDSDWFKVSLVQGISYGFQVSANGTSGLPDGDLFLRNATGNAIDSATNGSTTINTLAHTALASGTYFIDVSDNTFNDIGAYILRNLGLDSTVNNTATNLSLHDGTRIAGRIDVEADSDWVKFKGEQGVTYQFALSGTGALNDLGNVRLTLRDANGTLIDVETGVTTTITYTATSDGNLFLDVQGQGFYDTGAFYLSVISNAPTLNGTAVTDRLTGGANNTVINGLGGNDVLNGGDGNDYLIGGTGLDTLLGGEGNDTLSGGTSADLLSAGAGSDRLNAGAGNDALRGGLGSDIFIFNAGDGSDVIADFQNGSDRIEIQSGASTVSGLSIRQIGDDVRVVFGTTTILIENTDRVDITAADFLFT